MRLAVLLMGVMGLLPTVVQADQKPPEPTHQDRGLRFGIDADYGSDVHFGVGGRALWQVPGTRRIDLVLAFGYFFPPKTEGAVALERKYWEANANVAYDFDLRFKPYLGAGLNLARRGATLRFLGQDAGTTSGTDAGLNILGGLRFGDRSRPRVFAEGRYEVKGGDQFVVTIGVLLY